MLPRAGLVRIVTILALAAAPRCFSSDNTSLNPLPALWNESKSGSRAIMLHRIHKAGSSMITSFVVDVARQAMKAGPSTHWCVKTDTFHHAINTPCLFPSRAFLVAHLREPMRRLESVFFYHGPGKAYMRRGFLGADNDNVATAWRAWVERGDIAAKYFQEDCYFSNPYIRTFTGQGPGHSPSCETWSEVDRSNINYHACAGCDVLSGRGECRNEKQLWVSNKLLRRCKATHKCH